MFFPLGKKKFCRQKKYCINEKETYFFVLFSNHAFVDSHVFALITSEDAFQKK